MHKLFIAALIVCLSVSAQAQKAFSTIEERMTGREYTDTGLNKLTEEELAALNEWLRDHSVATMENAANQSQSTSGDTRGFEVEAAKELDRSLITARIEGPFTGWDGNTVFKLDNGMVWKQAEGDTFYVKEINNPQVTVKPGAFGTWRLSVEGYGSKVRVKRLQ